ncbi:hypothetical protein DM860_006700 [Cuscuta australis]|uniref:Uncharacterized protein n=1 Tax=Cuscuta australis TaxID=267555 RepID=A0A328D652_9ASTE|nr:hypothetical protein DM860_006700 [Cuscuta australis]
MAASSWSSIGFQGPNSSAGFLSRRNPSSGSPTTSKNIIVFEGLQVSSSSRPGAYRCLRRPLHHHNCNSSSSSSPLKNGKNWHTTSYAERGIIVACLSGGIDPAAIPLPPSASSPDSNPLKGWLIGILISAVIPFFRHKLGSFMQIKNAISEVEEVVHGVEKVAEVVDKVAEDIGGKLPAGKLKDAVGVVERAAEKADKDAEALGEIIDKVEEVEETVEEGVESLVELARHQAPAGGT